LNKHVTDNVASLLIITVVMIVYWKVSGFDFLLFDDHEYVLANSNINQGLSWNGLLWALTTGHVGNWHPLTWLSHMLDVEIFGITPGAHHLVNLGLHIINSLLLFQLVRKMGSTVWIALFTALLFALHPAHVESVAWVSERKDVLSTLFFLLGIIFYLEYIKTRDLRIYLVICLVFILGLMSKPMVITFPFVLMLFDFWPLRRWGSAGYKIIILEKLPLLALSLASALMTIKMQSVAGAMSLGETLSFTDRLFNAMVSVLRYLNKVVDVSGMTIFYPHPGNWPVLYVVLSAAVIIAISWFAFINRKTRPYMLFGWLLFLGTLVPVIGIVQVGTQSIADRYTYIPYIGIFVFIAWLANDLVEKYQKMKNTLVILSIAVLVFYAVNTFRYLDVWKDDGRLFENLISVHSENYSDYWSAEKNRNYLQKASSKLATFYNNKGLAFLREGQHGPAVILFMKAIDKNPNDYRPYYNLSLLSIEKGEFNDANLFMKKVLEIEPGLADKLKPYLDIIKRKI